MNIYFTRENTDGFTEEDLKKMNHVANDRIGDETDPDLVKGILDQINNEWPNLK